MGLFKRLRCDACGIRFSKEEELMNHRQIVHENPEYDCKECNAFFSNMEDMRTHLQRNHSYKKDR